ncbi:ester cyclase [Roseomonas sp. E05]|uniref:ester cyclase n=1 Tax=Roseomonas sp. E05 TaxID=3046310 RepID=UPI0024BB4BEA|nr:ester cyclase [Roseomonas sp. E05]MDJ0389596.1 ester cyclase [Roseomonas sp. E05]
MAGCRTLPDPCETPKEDPPTREESENRKVVREFIDRVWNATWSKEDSNRLLAGRGSGDNTYVPPSVEDTLGSLRHPDSIRHRRDRAGNPIRSSGPDDYKKCVNAVHMIVQDLRVEILDMVASGDSVVVQMLLRGTDRRADGKAELPGAFGAQPPTGKRFRMQTTSVYQLRDHRIISDRLMYGAPLEYED